MNEIIKITENNGKKAVSARDLYNFLDVATPFHKWIPRMLDYGFEKDIDWTKMSSDNQSFNLDYILTIDCAKEISMIQRTDKGKEARKYFIECEKQLTQSVSIPQSFAEALQLAADQAKQLELQAPKVESYDKFIDSSSLQSFKDVANVLGLGRNTLMKQLRELKILTKKNTPYQRYLDMNLFEVKESTQNGFNIATNYVTPKGIEYIKKTIIK